MEVLTKRIDYQDIKRVKSQSVCNLESRSSSFGLIDTKALQYMPSTLQEVTQAQEETRQT